MAPSVWRASLALLGDPRQTRLFDEAGVWTGETMNLKDYVPEVALADGESVSGVFDPEADVPEEKGSLGGTVFTFVLKTKKGPVILKGGKGLMNKMRLAAEAAGFKPVTVTVTAHGEARTTARFYDVKKA